MEVINAINENVKVLGHVTRIFTEYEDIDGYGNIRLINTGRGYSFIVEVYQYTGDLELYKEIPADISRGWETMRTAYAEAANLYNKYVPESIPTF